MHAGKTRASLESGELNVVYYSEDARLFRCPPHHSSSLPQLSSKASSAFSVLHDLEIPALRLLEHAGVVNGRGFGVFNLASTTTRCLNGLDDVHRLVVCDLAEDYVFAVKPAGDDSGDEEPVSC